MRRHFLLLLAIIFIVTVFAIFQKPSRGFAQPTSPLEPRLAAILDNSQPGQFIDVVVILQDQVDVRVIQGQDRGDRTRALILALKNKAEHTQTELRGRLSNWSNQGLVRSVKPLWITNAVAISAQSAVIREIAARSDVKSIVLDATIQAPSMPELRGGSEASPQASLNIIHAPSLWDLGYQGQGVVVANMDTGVDYTHPDLNAQWRGGSNSWYDPYGQHPTTPVDMNGHGTWTMGVMVGRDLSGMSIGVAPRSSWIAVKIFNDSGTATTSAIHLGFQWLLDPDGNPQTNDAPDVVNNSWTFNSPGCDLSFEPDLQALVVAGITPVFAAGNFGPGTSTSASPANNPSAFPVGAIYNSSLIYAYSSRGPTGCGRAAPVTYPSLMAPGVGILTTDLYGGYYSTSGTSLSAPHVSGALALLLNAFPNLAVVDQQAALVNSAVDLGSPGPDNNFGYGRLDVLAAYNAILNPNAPTATPTVGSATPTPSNTPVPTNTPLPANTSTPTNTPLPSNTSTPTNTPLPTNTAAPTNTPLPANTSTPTNTPLPTNTAAPTNTPLPTNTPSPTYTPLPTNTPRPTNPPSPTNTPTRRQR